MDTAKAANLYVSSSFSKARFAAEESAASQYTRMLISLTSSTHLSGEDYPSRRPSGR